MGGDRSCIFFFFGKRLYKGYRLYPLYIQYFKFYFTVVKKKIIENCKPYLFIFY